MVELFQDGGWAMWPLLILLIIGVAVAIERLFNLSRSSIDAANFFANLEEALGSGGARRSGRALLTDARSSCFSYPRRAPASGPRHRPRRESH